MSRSQKRQQQFGFTDYGESDFVGLRENNIQGQQGQGGGRFYANGGRGGGGRGGGMRKHQQQQQNLTTQQPRTFYVNAEFLQQNASEFQNAIAMNGIRRRIGWGGAVLDNDPCNINIGRHPLDIRPHGNAIIASDIRLEDHCETSRETITDLSVTVPSTSGFVEYGNNGNIHIRDRDKARPRSRQNNNEFNSNNNNSSNFRKRRRRSDSEPDRRSGKRHKKSRRHPSRRVVRDEDEQDSGDMRLSSVSDDLEIEEDEDLRNTIVRQKTGRNKFRREPGEILDTDESTSSSPKPDDSKDRRGRRKNSSSRRKTLSSNNAAVGVSVFPAASSTSTKNNKDSGRVSSPELRAGSRPITAETPTKKTGESNADFDSVQISSQELEIVEDQSRPITAETLTQKNEESNKESNPVPISSPELEVVEDPRPKTAETGTPTKKKEDNNNNRDSVRVSSKELEVVADSRPTTAETLMEAKIKALRGRRTAMENEIEGLKKNVSRSEKHLKEVEQKLKKVEQELKLKQEEVESLKRQAAANDPNKPDVQLIYAMAYQDKLFVEVEKVKSAFEIEVLKLQEYYESRLAHYRNQGLNPGAFMSSNNFPKGCVVTPLNLGQQMQVGHQEQIGMPRTESRSGQLQQQSQQMGMFAHLGNPDSVAPPIINIPQGISRARLPVFLNPMMRRMQQQGGGIGVLDTQSLNIQTMQQQPANQTASSISNSAPSSSNSNGNSSNHIHNGTGR